MIDPKLVRLIHEADGLETALGKAAPVLRSFYERLTAVGFSEAEALRFTRDLLAYLVGETAISIRKSLTDD